ncbi:MAG: S1 RNA-binding domain-containing protein, partial [Clostridia bacterium]|nr:S1 RNA-binding domain-containing protein [Clostridia bacterium]
RMHILGKMLEVLPAPRESLSKYAPKILHFFINPEKIGEVVGPRGKTINKIIEGIAKDLQVGDVFTGKVARIMSFGAFVEYAPGKDGMIHISKLANERVEKVEDVVNIGDTLECKVAEIDAQGRINLLRNDIVYDDESMPVRRPPRRDGDRDRRDGDRRPRR